MRHTCTTVLFISLCAVFVSTLASAQDYSKIEVFGGYSYLHVDTQGISNSSLIALCTGIIGAPCPGTFKIRPGFQGWEASGRRGQSRSQRPWKSDQRHFQFRSAVSSTGLLRP